MVLAVDPTVTSPFPLLGLAREPRQPSAFFGYVDGIAESYWIVTVDSQSNDPFCPFLNDDSYQRLSVTAKSGTVYR